MKKKPFSFWVGYAYTFVTLAAFVGLTYLKLDGFIDVSWWVVTAPLWGSLIAALIVVIIAGLWAIKIYKDAQKNK